MTLPVAILAGGLATRLRPLTEAIPKSMIEVAGEPFVLHQLRLLRKNGIRRVVLCVGYQGEMIQERVGEGREMDLVIQYSHDGPALLGTGGALKKALPLLGKAFYVLYGDSYLECDYRAVEESFYSHGKPALMTVFRNEGRWDRSNIEFEGARIIRYDKHHPTQAMRHIDYGLGILTTGVLEDVPTDRPADLALIYKRIAERGELAGQEVEQRFYEIGSPEGLREIRAYLEAKKRRGGA